jgi:hypothetical protein
MHNQFEIYCIVAYTPLNMFRALLCPSSGAPSNCLCSHWLPYDYRDCCGRFKTDHSLKHVQPGNHTVTSGCKGSWRGLLMMGTTVPETCWAVYTLQCNKFQIDCASSWLFYWKMTDYGLWRRRQCHRSKCRELLIQRHNTLSQSYERSHNYTHRDWL